MTPAQDLLREIRDDLRGLGVWGLLHPDTRDRVDTELARAAHPANWAAGPVVGAQVHRRFGLIRDTPPDGPA